MCLEQCNSQVQLKHYAAKKKIKQKISPNPIENLSQKTHPMDQTSHGCDHPNSRMTSGAR